MNAQPPDLANLAGRTYRVVIVAAYPTVQFGLRAAVEAGEGFVVEEVIGELAHLAATADEIDPDAFVADISWTIEELQDIGDLEDLPPVLLLTEVDGDAVAAISAGFAGVLLRDATTEEIQAALVGLAAGLTVIDSRVVPLFRGAGGVETEPKQLAGIEALTNRETEVLELIAAGLTNKGIAAQLGISEHTVKFHVGSILGKLDAASRSEAIARAMQAGLLHI